MNEPLKNSSSTAATHAALTSINLDLRGIAPRDRHQLVFSAFTRLSSGEVLEIVNDHDPAPLRFQLQAQWPGQASWRYVESGPQAWRVAIKREVAEPVPADTSPCCGGCGCS